MNAPNKIKTTAFALRRRAIKNFPRVDYADPFVTTSLRRKWLNSVMFLGDDWLMLKTVERKSDEEVRRKP